MYPTIFGFIDSYAVFLGLGVVASLVLFEIYFRKILKENPAKIFYLEILLAFALVFGMLGAYLVQNFYDFIQDPSHYSWSWRSTFFGGLIFGVGGFILAFFLFVRKRYPDGLMKIVVITPASVALAHAFGRIGCFMDGCCYGKVSDAWYAMYFPVLQKTVIPTQLFEAIFLFILSALLILIAFKKRSLYTIPVYAMSYGVWRFLIEFLRDDYRGSLIPGISPSQFWALVLFVGGAAVLVLLMVKRSKAQAKASDSGKTESYIDHE